MNWIKNALFKVGCWLIATVALIGICAAIILGTAIIAILSPVICLCAPLSDIKDLFVKDEPQMLND